MNKYKFKLEKLLDLRKEKEEAAHKEFIEAGINRDKTIQQLDNIKNNYKIYSVSKSQESVIERKIRNNYLNALTIEINKVSLKLDNENIEVELKRKEVVERQVERKTVEKLKEKGEDVFSKEQQDIEQKANDEFALFGYIRKQEGR